jgi:hypothetical protein
LLQYVAFVAAEEALVAAEVAFVVTEVLIEAACCPRTGTAVEQLVEGHRLPAVEGKGRN